MTDDRFRAANCHDDLVAALTMARTWIEKATESVRFSPQAAQPGMDAIKQIDAALALAKARWEKP